MVDTNASRSETGHDTDNKTQQFRSWASQHTDGVFTRAAAVEFLTKKLHMSVSRADNTIYRESETTSQWGVRRLRPRGVFAPAATAPAAPAPTEMLTPPPAVTGTMPGIIPEVQELARKLGFVSHRKPATRPGFRSSDQLDVQFLTHFARTAGDASLPLGYLDAMRGMGMQIGEVAHRIALYTDQHGSDYVLKPEAQAVARALLANPLYANGFPKGGRPRDANGKQPPHPRRPRSSKSYGKRIVHSTHHYASTQHRRTAEELDREFIAGVLRLDLPTPVITSFSSIQRAVDGHASMIAHRLRLFANREASMGRRARWSLTKAFFDRAAELGIALPWTDPNGVSSAATYQRQPNTTTFDIPTPPKAPATPKAEPRPTKATKPAPQPKTPTTHNRNITYTHRVEGAYLTPLYWIAGASLGLSVFALALVIGQAM